jgi:hypothetical protein
MNNTDEHEYDAFVLDDSNEPDEHSPESIFGFDNESIHAYYRTLNTDEL